MPPALSKPHLPAAFMASVQAAPCMAGYKSAVFEEDAHDHRVACCNWSAPRAPDLQFCYGPQSNRAMLGFTVEAKRTTLHLAALEGDVLAACELIRLGATVDAADSRGLTPLSLAVAHMSTCKNPQTPHPPAAKRDVAMTFLRLAYVSRILIQQHANVHIKYDDIPILEIACSIQNWELIELLLQHGAKPLNEYLSYFDSRAERARFISLRSSYASSIRPARLCRCWSGKPLAECHGAAAQRYPEDFICACGSKKTYKRCCHARSHFIIEKWDEGLQRIMPHFTTTSPAYSRMGKDVDPKKLNILDQLAQEISAAAGLPLPSAPSADKISRIVMETLELLASRGLVDLAFLYAYRQIGSIPQPRARAYSEHLALERQSKWNEAVDEYIQQGNDPRPRFEIERAAKIGKWQGALIRMCEGAGCTNVEGVGGIKLQMCGKCKIAVYCSVGCQRSAWTTHKALCCSEDQHEQMLPSQANIVKASSTVMGNAPAFTDNLIRQGQLLTGQLPKS
ncbi:hypothetical protein BOTBODRAFT_70632 [Botryobasidium botryosum FD-172 SS1]|uniref:MYND-type domain-containing protein n=1 Tax=Botryobasidium botryosum (strain FD-172 SS1) TaxID=930990 RepID=A0A067LV43_BOTB1|nr:hypothetical protein BOTBODRAFT_70632 [Botryobasidium botryosum FD-172 SS1]